MSAEEGSWTLVLERDENKTSLSLTDKKQHTELLLHVFS